MRAAILAGGRGERLRPLTEAIPKPLLPVGKRPIVQILIEKLREEGFHEIHIALGYRGELIESYFGDGAGFGVRLHYHWEREPLGTAGPIRHMGLSQNGPVLCVNGDILTKTNFADLVRRHSDTGADMTVATVPYRFQVPFGVLVCEEDSVRGVREKPEICLETFGGIAALSPAAIEHIPAGEPYNMTDLIQTLATNGGTVVKHPVSEFWMDIGRRDDYARANELVKQWETL